MFLSCPEGVRVSVLGLCCVKGKPFVRPCRESCGVRGVGGKGEWKRKQRILGIRWVREKEAFAFDGDQLSTFK